MPQTLCKSKWAAFDLTHTESKASSLGLAEWQVALAAEGTSASCKHCVMSIFHLPPQHPWGSQLEGRRLQSVETAAFPTEKRHFSVRPSSTGPHWSCCERSLSFWNSSETWGERHLEFVLKNLKELTFFKAISITGISMRVRVQLYFIWCQSALHTCTNPRPPPSFSLQGKI